MEETIITWEEFSQHTNSNSCWQLIDGVIYDATTYLIEHPGGQQVLLQYAGLDGTDRFNQAGHSEYAQSIRNARRVGKIESLIQPAQHNEKVKNIKAQFKQKQRQKQLQRRKKFEKPSEPAAKKGKSFSLEQISKHNTKEDCWILIDHKVYDVTHYHQEHPGSPKQILNFAGADASKGFNGVNHSQAAKNTRNKYFIGFEEGFENFQESSSKVWILILLLIIAGVISYQWLL